MSCSQIELCIIPDFPECKITELGTEYRGSLNVGISGRPCREWASVTINKQFKHRFVTFSDDENFCRNPDSKSGGPWCYLEGLDGEWEYCDVPFCKRRHIALCVIFICFSFILFLKLHTSFSSGFPQILWIQIP